MEIYKEFLEIEYEDEEDIETTCPWIIRFTFDKDKMLDKNIIMDDYIKIGNTFIKNLKNGLFMQFQFITGV